MGVGTSVMNEIEKYPDFDTNGDNVSKYYHTLHKIGAMTINTIKPSINPNDDGVVVRLKYCSFKPRKPTSISSLFIVVAKDIMNVFRPSSIYIYENDMLLFFPGDLITHPILTNSVIELTRIVSFATTSLLTWIDETASSLDEPPLDVLPSLASPPLWIFQGVILKSPVTSVKWHTGLCEYIISLNSHSLTGRNNYANNQYYQTYYGTLVRDILIPLNDTTTDVSCVYKTMRSLSELQGMMTFDNLYKPTLTISSDNLVEEDDVEYIEDVEDEDDEDVEDDEDDEDEEEE